MHAGMSSGDKDAVRSGAHSLKSSSANLGALRLAELCKQLEAAARVGNFGPQTPALTDLDAEYARVRSELERHAGATV